MRQNRDLTYLGDILDSIQRIESYTADVSKNKFIENFMMQDAVMRQIEIIGEAVRHISKDIRKSYPEVPWQDVAGMRDKLIHGYFGVDIEKVWDTAQEDLPVLKQQVIGILKDFGQ